MPRPSTLYTWATNANYTGGPAVGTPSRVAPSVGQQAEGHEPGDKPGGQLHNALFGNIFDWLNWLNANTLDGNWTFTGDVQVDGTLGVTGAVTLASDLAVTGNLTANRAARVRKLPIALGSADAGSSLVAGAWTPAAVSNNYAMPIELHEGERLTQVVAYVECGTTDQFVMQVYRWDAATKTATQLGTNQTSTLHTGAAEALTQSGLTETCSAANHYNYYALIQCTARGAGTLSLMGVELTTDGTV